MKLRYGLLGTGNIANQFAAGVLQSSRSTLTAVGSRSADTARAFAGKYNIPVAHGSYDALLADPTVDAIYLSLPNTMHHEWTIKSLKAGKHVLCEKPFATNAAQSEEMFDVARKQGRLLMEAFMYRTHPLTKAVVAAVDSGAIGPVRHIRTSFCYRTTRIVNNIRFDPALAGGALMDVGCYCLSFTRLFAKAEPTTVHAVANIHETGVDDLTTCTMQFPGGLTATFTCAMTVQADNTATLCGQEAFLEVPIPWKPPTERAVYTIARSIPPRQDLPPNAPRPPSMTGAAPPRETFTVDTHGALYGIEADDFATSVLGSVPTTIPPAETLGIMKLLDTIRRQIGLPC
jgi:xylose dehydrogenase (NAD/NADP)